MKNNKLRETRKILRHRMNEIRKNFHITHIKRTTAALLLTIPYLGLEWSARAFNLYASFPAIDNFIHFFFGVAFVSIAFLLYEKKSKLTLFWVFIVALFWEAIEISGDYFVPAAALMLDPFFYDGIKDVALTFLGAVAVFYYLKYNIKLFR